MIRVVHIITALGSGGAERVLNLVASAPSHDVNQAVICLTDEGVYGRTLRESGVTLHCLRMQRGRSPLGAFVALIRLLRSLEPDVIMTWLYHADLMGTLAGRLAGVRRIIWNIRCSSMEFASYAPTTHRIVKVLARLSRVPSAVAANSEAGRQAHAALGYRPRRWVYLPNGFDTDFWRPDANDRTRVRRQLGIADDDRVVGLIARVDPQKGHAYFFEALNLLAPHHPRLRILLAGKGTGELPIPSGLRPQTHALGERHDVDVLMRTLDVCVVASTFGEGFPNVVGEAMASGVPCVATDVGDSALVIGDTGRIVPPRNSQALATAMAELLDQPSGHLHALGARARVRIQSEYSIATCFARYRSIFQNLANTRP
jgi:glycosyltransferase involved in cell wall biosynthesis